MNIDYKPLCDLESLETIVIASLVASTLWVRMMLAPFITHIASAVIDPDTRSDGVFFCKIDPRKDLFETETRIGKDRLIDDKF